MCLIYSSCRNIQNLFSIKGNIITETNDIDLHREVVPVLRLGSSVSEVRYVAQKSEAKARPSSPGLLIRIIAALYFPDSGK